MILINTSSKIIIPVIVIGIIIFLFAISSTGNSPNSLVILVDEDDILTNPYTISIVNPFFFEGSIKESLESSLDSTKTVYNWFLNNSTKNSINSYQITNLNLFTSEETTNQIPIDDHSPSSYKILIGIPTSMDNSGLFDYLLEEYNMDEEVQIVPIVKSSNGLLLDASRGNINLLITHSPTLEEEYTDLGVIFFSQNIFKSEFCIIGPQSDPANILGENNASKAFELIKISASNKKDVFFISRGDFSGTHAKELSIWYTVNQNPITSDWTTNEHWYLNGGSSQSGTYRLTLEIGGYAIIDKPTFFMNQNIHEEGVVEGISTAVMLIFTFDSETWSIVFLSLSIHVFAILFAMIIAIPSAFFTQKHNFPGKNLILILTNSMMAIPPVVLGLILWLMFSSAGYFGNFGLLFTSPLMVLSQFVLAFPIIFSISFSGFKSINPKFFSLLKKYKLSMMTQLKLVIRESFSSSLIAVITALSRILGEVGAMLIIGGNIRWQTRVLTTSIVNELESGAISIAIALGIILISFALFVNIILVLLQSGNKLISDDKRIKVSRFFIERDLKNSTTTQEFDFFSANRPSKEFSISFTDVFYSPSEDFTLSIPEFTISNNQVVGITGHNSSGKSTFLRLLADEIKPDSGTIKTTADNLRIEFVSQRPFLFNTSVFNNLKYSLSSSNDPKSLNYSKIHYLLEFFGLQQYIAYPVGLLSRGNQNKIAIIRSILRDDVSLYLFDEIFVNLDADSVKKMTHLIKSFKNKKSFIIVSHKTKLLEGLTKEIITLNKGKLVIK